MYSMEKMKIIQMFRGYDWTTKDQTSKVYRLIIVSFQKSKTLGSHLAFKQKRRRRKGNSRSYSFWRII